MKTLIKLIKYSVIGLIVIVSMGVGGLLGVGYSHYKEVTNDVAIEEQVKRIQEDKNYVTLEEVDEDFLSAIVAVEDRRFFEHGAVDLIGLARAIGTNFIKGELVQGGSTITQQLAKNMYFGSEQTIKRKAAELFVAYEIEKQYTKNEVLEMYINMIYFGNGCYGIQEASRHFYNKPPSELTIEESAMLAGLPQSPSRYAADSELAKKRQQVVLNALEDIGYID